MKRTRRLAKGHATTINKTNRIEANRSERQSHGSLIVVFYTCNYTLFSLKDNSKYLYNKTNAFEKQKFEQKMCLLHRIRESVCVYHIHRDTKTSTPSDSYKFRFFSCAFTSTVWYYILYFSGLGFFTVFLSLSHTHKHFSFDNNNINNSHFNLANTAIRKNEMTNNQMSNMKESKWNWSVWIVCCDRQERSASSFAFVWANVSIWLCYNF